MEVSLFDLAGDGVSNEEIAAYIINKLENKYKEKFNIERIGSRYGTGTDDYVLTYCSPKNNKKLVFQCKLDDEKTSFSDEYLLRRSLYELQEFVENKFNELDIDAIVKIELVGQNHLKNFMSIQGIVNEYPNSNFLAYIVIKDDINKNQILEIYEAILKKYININFRSLIYKVGEKEFAECKEEFETVPTVNSSIIKNYKIQKDASVKISQNRINIVKWGM